MGGIKAKIFLSLLERVESKMEDSNKNYSRNSQFNKRFGYQSFAYSKDTIETLLASFSIEKGILTKKEADKLFKYALGVDDKSKDKISGTALYNEYKKAEKGGDVSLSSAKLKVLCCYAIEGCCDDHENWEHYWENFKKEVDIFQAVLNDGVESASSDFEKYRRRFRLMASLFLVTLLAFIATLFLYFDQKEPIPDFSEAFTYKINFPMKGKESLWTAGELTFRRAWIGENRFSVEGRNLYRSEDDKPDETIVNRGIGEIHGRYLNIYLSPVDKVNRKNGVGYWQAKIFIGVKNEAHWDKQDFEKQLYGIGGGVSGYIKNSDYIHCSSNVIVLTKKDISKESFVNSIRNIDTLNTYFYCERTVKTKDGKKDSIVNNIVPRIDFKGQ
jgi:hypothetical protein